jgi:hypothetical protein
MVPRLLALQANSRNQKSNEIREIGANIMVSSASFLHFLPFLHSRHDTPFDTARKFKYLRCPHQTAWIESFVSGNRHWSSTNRQRSARTYCQALRRRERRPRWNMTINGPHMWRSALGVQTRSPEFVWSQFWRTANLSLSLAGATEMKHIGYWWLQQSRWHLDCP